MPWGVKMPLAAEHHRHVDCNCVHHRPPWFEFILILTPEYRAVNGSGCKSRNIRKISMGDYEHFDKMGENLDKIEEYSLTFSK